MVSITKAATHARMHAAAAAAVEAAAHAACIPVLKQQLMPCSMHPGFEAAAHAMQHASRF